MRTYLRGTREKFTFFSVTTVTVQTKNVHNGVRNLCVYTFQRAKISHFCQSRKFSSKLFGTFKNSSYLCNVNHDYPVKFQANT